MANGNEDGDALDRLLAARATRGDEAAFAALVARHRPALERFARRQLDGGREEAEDAVQDALINAYRSLRSGKRPDHVRPWLYTIVRNGCIDRRRAARPTVALEREELPSIADTLTVVEERAALTALFGSIAELPDRQRDLVIARELGGTSYAQLAREHDTTVPAVKSLLLRARRSLIASRAAHALVLPATALARRFSALGGNGGGGGGAGDGAAVAAAGAGTGGAVFAALGGLAGKAAVVAALATGVTFALPASHPGTAVGDAQSVHVVRHARRAQLVSQPAAPHRVLAAEAAHHAAPPPKVTRPSAAPPPPSTETPAARHQAANLAIAACRYGKPVDPHTSPAALAEAQKELPADIAEYTDCTDQLRDAALQARAG